jgi:hypothetical protein
MESSFIKTREALIAIVPGYEMAVNAARFGWECIT